MLRSRGFSLFEIMLSLIVVSIGISILLHFTAANQRETSSKTTGNDYGLVVNDLLEQFLNDVANCNGTSTQGNCSYLKNVSAGTTASDYLSTHGITLSDEQNTALKAKGINLDTITVTVTASKSDPTTT